MNNQKKWLKQAKNLCGAIGTEDGIDPRLLARQREENQHSHRKTQQLCKEAKRLLSLVLSGEISDPVIQDLQVPNVTAEANGQYLLVTLCHSDSSLVLSNDPTLDRLQQLQGYLRSVITRSVQRKRVPCLRFKLASHMNEVTQ